MDLFNTGVRPLIDDWLIEESKKTRDYGDFWSASSAGYCMRKNIFERLNLPHIETDGDARKQRVFTAGKMFHEWIQGITKKAGISVAQEVELQDEDLMIRGHFDDLILIEEPLPDMPYSDDGKGKGGKYDPNMPEQHLILYDYKTVNSRAFMWAKKNGNAMSHFHRLQLGTYMYMLRKDPYFPWAGEKELSSRPEWLKLSDLAEARILKIEKDTLMMMEQQLLWSPELEKDVVSYWKTLNGYWKSQQIPNCTCADFEGGFMAKPQYNPFFYNGEPCSVEYFAKFKELSNEWKERTK